MKRRGKVLGFKPEQANSYTIWISRDDEQPHPVFLNVDKMQLDSPFQRITVCSAIREAIAGLRLGRLPEPVIGGKPVKENPPPPRERHRREPPTGA